ncbi:MAG: hypothetical protein U9Q07_00915 [Planctomycetota bacterium]|nr:hypothetical protein [Planctomycetota bacterium]
MSDDIVAKPRKRSKLNLTDQQFGRLTVLSEAEPVGYKRRWHCKCTCGRKTIVQQGNLRRGTTTSCGCWLRERATTHGAASRGKKTPEYRVWRSLINRCTNPNVSNYHHYGGRGINVCPAWRDFAVFLADMGPKPSPKHSIDRIDNEGDYEPGNTRWATRKQQNRNTRANHLLTFYGQTQCVTDWAGELKIHPSTLYARLRRGWPVERALTTPILCKGA